MINVKKRDGSIVDFDLSKIRNAIEKAFVSVNRPFTDEILDTIALKVCAKFSSSAMREGIVDIESIQDAVEVVLIQASYEDVAKSYILYRKQHEKMRNMKSTIIDYRDTINNYLKVSDWRVKENSTVTYSVGGLILSNSGALTANYWLS